MARKKGIKFLTTKEKKARQFRLFTLGFLAFLLAFALISVAYMLKSHHLSLSELFPEKTTAETEESTDDVSAALAGKASFMLACVSDEKDELYLVAAVYADLDLGEVRVSAFDPNTQVEAGGVRDTLRGHYLRSASKGLCGAVNELCGFETDRYAISTESQFKSAINALSGAVVTVPQRINYKTKELSLSLMPGEQTIKGETLLRYFRYCLTENGGGASEQSRLLCVLFSQYISKSYLAYGRSYFSEIIDSLDSNISIVDFSRCENQLSAMAASEIKYTPVTLSGELIPQREENKK